jgi:FkbM family methyltransferase
MDKGALEIMDKRKFLIWPWNEYKDAVGHTVHLMRKYFSNQLNHLLLDTDARKFTEVKTGVVSKNKCEQSLEYVLLNWPKGHPRRVAIQAGGCLGLWPKILSYSFDTVYTFEAQPDAFYLLNLNCPERNIVKMQMALGSENGKFIDIPMTNKPGQGKIHSGGNIPMVRLDDFNFSQCDVLMLDVEGYEPQILKGAEKLINRCKPYILCEDNWNSEEIKSILESYGYELITKANKDRIFKHKSKEWPGGQWDKYTKGVKK